LTGVQWLAIEPYCLGKAGDPGQTGGDARLFLEAVLWMVRTGSQWRDLPARAKRRNPVSYDAEKYKWRHLIENFFQKLKEFKSMP
jgi:transposase